MNEGQLSALAERFCATPLPDNLCADLVATTPVAGRTGTHLMTVAQAKQILAAVLADTPPATPAGGGENTLRRALRTIAEYEAGQATHTVPAGGWTAGALRHVKAIARDALSTSSDAAPEVDPRREIIAWAIWKAYTDENRADLERYGNAMPFADAVIAALSLSPSPDAAPAREAGE